MNARLKNIMSLVEIPQPRDRAVRIVAMKWRARRPFGPELRVERSRPSLCVGLQTSHERLTEGLPLRITRLDNGNL